MIDIKEKIRELCKSYVEDTIVEEFLKKNSSKHLYDDLIKDMFVESDMFNINDDYSLSVWKYEV